MIHVIWTHSSISVWSKEPQILEGFFKLYVCTVYFLSNFDAFFFFELVASMVSGSIPTDFLSVMAFKLNLIAVRLVQEEVLVELLRS